MSNRRKTRTQRAEQSMRQPRQEVFADPGTGETYGTVETVDMIEHAEDCDGLLEYSRVEDRGTHSYEVWECTRCGPVWFELDGEEVSRGGPPEDS